MTQLGEDSDQIAFVFYYHEDDTLTAVRGNSKKIKFTSSSAVEIGTTANCTFNSTTYLGIVVEIKRGLKALAEATALTEGKENEGSYMVRGRTLAVEKRLTLIEGHNVDDYAGRDWRNSVEIWNMWNQGLTHLSVDGITPETRADDTELNATTVGNEASSNRRSRLKRRVSVLEDTIKEERGERQQSELALNQRIEQGEAQIMRLQDSLLTLHALIEQNAGQLPVAAGVRRMLTVTELADSYIARGIASWTKVVHVYVKENFTVDVLATSSPKGGNQTNRPPLNAATLARLYELIPVFVARNSAAREDPPKRAAINQKIHGDTSSARTNKNKKPGTDDTPALQSPELESVAPDTAYRSRSQTQHPYPVFQTAQVHQPPIGLVEAFVQQPSIPQYVSTGVQQGFPPFAMNNFGSHTAL